MPHKSWKPKRREGESEVKYFARYQAAEAKYKASGKPKPTAGQKRTAAAGKTRQSIIGSVPGSTGLQALQGALAPKKKKKK